MGTTHTLSAADAVLRSSPLSVGDRAAVLIPLDERHVAVAFVRALADSSVAAVVFGPAAVRSTGDATTLIEPWNPDLMRKVVASDLPLRTGTWELIDTERLGANVAGLDAGCADFLQQIADGFNAQRVVIHTDRPAPDLASHESAAAVYVAPVDRGIEQAVRHLLGVDGAATLDDTLVSTVGSRT